MIDDYMSNVIKKLKKSYDLPLSGLRLPRSPTPFGWGPHEGPFPQGALSVLLINLIKSNQV